MRPVQSRGYLSSKVHFEIYVCLVFYGLRKPLTNIGFEPAEVWEWHFCGKNSTNQSRSLLPQLEQIITLKNEYNLIPFDFFARCNVSKFSTIHQLASLYHHQQHRLCFHITCQLSFIVILIFRGSCYLNLLAIALLNKCLMLPSSLTIALATKHSVQALGTKCVLQN